MNNFKVGQHWLDKQGTLCLIESIGGEVYGNEEDQFMQVSKPTCEPEHSFGYYEDGTSHTGEQHTLTTLCRPHADAITAWAHGAEIQRWDGWFQGVEQWVDELSPAWYKDSRYRIKPEMPAWEAGLLCDTAFEEYCIAEEALKTAHKNYRKTLDIYNKIKE